jgi:diguanylate cyclase (GGDEF)-like protein/PAS domain S-box-containing protein
MFEQNLKAISQAFAKPSIDHAALLDLLPGFVAYIDRDLRFRYVNWPYAQARGMAPDAFVGRSWQEIVGADNYLILHPHMQKCFSGERVNFDYELVAGGRNLHLQGDLVPDVDVDGTVLGALAAFTDLNPRLDLQTRIDESEALFHDAFSNSPLGMALVDTSARIIRCNRKFAAILGRSQAELVDMRFADLTHPDDVASDTQLFQQVLEGNRDGYTLDKRYIRPDGQVVLASLFVSAMRNKAGEIVRFVSHVEDVTAQREAQRRLSESNAQLQLAMEVLHGGFWHFDVATVNFMTSDRLAQYIGGPSATAMHAPEYLAHVFPDDLHIADITTLVSGETERNTVEYRLDTFAGTRWIRCDRKLLRNAAGQPDKIVGVVVDITEEHELLLQAEQRAETDSLTSLLNRRGLQTRFARQSQSDRCCVMTIDLDGFKAVNDTFGHAAGDHVLKATAERLHSAVREDDFVARLGGDEFVVILVNTDDALVRAIAGRINEVVRVPFFLEGQSAHIGCSIGISCADGWPSSLEAILRKADKALYQAKADGKNGWRFAG